MCPLCWQTAGWAFRTWTGWRDRSWETVGKHGWNMSGPPKISNHQWTRLWTIQFFVLERPLVHVVKCAGANGLTSYMSKYSSYGFGWYHNKTNVYAVHEKQITSASGQPGQPVGNVLRNLSADVGQGVCTSETEARVQHWNWMHPLHSWNFVPSPLQHFSYLRDVGAQWSLVVPCPNAVPSQWGWWWGVATGTPNFSPNRSLTAYSHHFA